MVTVGVSPRMMAQKAQVAGISREPTAVPGPVPNIPNGPAPRPRAGPPLAPAARGIHGECVVTVGAGVTGQSSGRRPNVAVAGAAYFRLGSSSVSATLKGAGEVGGAPGISASAS